MAVQTSPWQIRVHGVSGTSPETLLESPNVERVAGDATSGFYQRAPIGGPGAERLEAYSWGGLTSGGKTRALWLLLGPFLLANTAFWMAPTPLSPIPKRAGEPFRRRRGFAAAIHRLFGLTLTATLVLGTIAASMDVLGFQYGSRPDSSVGWLRVFQWQWLSPAGRRLAVVSIVPLAAIALLWWLGHQTWMQTEATRVPAAEPAGIATPLEDRSMWNGKRPIRRLRAIHVGTGFALTALLLVAARLHGNGQPATTLSPINAWRSGAWGIAAAIVAGVTCALLLSFVVLCATGKSGERPRPLAAGADAPASRGDRLPGMLRRAAIGALIASVDVVCGKPPTGPDAVHGPGNLPGLTATIQWLIASQLGLLLLLFVVTWTLRAARRTPPAISPVPVAARPTWTSPAAVPVSRAVAWGGFAGPGIALLAWLLATTFAAGLTWFVARTVGTPIPDFTRPGKHSIAIPAPLVWVASVGLAAAVVGLLAILVTFLKGRRAGKSFSREAVISVYDDVLPARGTAPPAESAGQDPDRVMQVQHAWGRAQLTDEVQDPVGVGTIAVTVLVVVAAFWFVFDRIALRHVPQLITLGVLAVAGGVGYLLKLGMKEMNDPDLRRRIGILFDLGCFWPRAVHPLAPPCYTERAVPELLRRIDYRAESGGVLLACHSQGTIIGAATLMQLRYAELDRTAFLTFGCPLTRLYSRFFPAYFDAGVLGRLASFLHPAPRPESAESVLEIASERAQVRWDNLIRPSDPIGGPVFVDYLMARDNGGDIDWPVIDPSFPRPPGDRCYPLTYAHSNYFVALEFDASVRALSSALSSALALPSPVAPAARTATAASHPAEKLG